MLHFLEYIFNSNYITKFWNMVLQTEVECLELSHFFRFILKNQIKYNSEGKTSNINCPDDCLKKKPKH